MTDTDRIAELEAGLRQHGAHDANCASLGRTSTDEYPGRCNCGLDALLSKGGGQ